MLEQLFTSRVRVKVLETFLVTSSGAEVHIRELARKLNTSPPHIMKVLGSLASLGILTKVRRGNMVLYKLNKSSTIAEDIKRILLKTESLGYELQKTLIASGKQSIRYALIYGSFAKGTEVTSSDIDLLVIGDIVEDEVVKTVLKAQKRIGREINYIVWSEKEFREKVHSEAALLREIARTPVIMLIGDEHEFKRSIKKAHN
jgi:predicted nucleotidyltransferase